MTTISEIAQPIPSTDRIHSLVFLIVNVSLVAVVLINEAAPLPDAMVSAGSRVYKHTKILFAEASGRVLLSSWFLP